MDNNNALISPKWLSLVGGVLIQSCLGTVYLWGNITTVVTSNLRLYDPSITYDNTLLAYAATLGCQGFSMILGGVLNSQFGTKVSVALGGTLVALGYILSAYATSLLQLIFSYGFLFGLGTGLCNTPSFSCAVKHMPDNRGLVVGVVAAGNGIGAYLFGNLAMSIYNPTNANTDADGYFSAESGIPQRAEAMFLTLGAIILGLTIVSSLLVSDPEPVASTFSTRTGKYESLELVTAQSENSMKSYNTPDKLPISSRRRSTKIPRAVLISPTFSQSSPDSLLKPGDDNLCHLHLDPWQLLESPLFWHLSSCFVLTTVGGVYFSGTFKTFGETMLNDQLLLSEIGNVSNIFNSLGRIFWGQLADVLGPVQTMKVVSVLFSIVLGSYSASLSYGGGTMFAASTFLILFFLAANFTIYFPIMIELFGDKHAPINYGILIATYTVFNVLNLVVLSSLTIDFQLACNIMFGVTFAGFLNLVAFSVHAKTYDDSIPKVFVLTGIFSKPPPEEEGDYEHLDHLDHDHAFFHH